VCRGFGVVAFITLEPDSSHTISVGTQLTVAKKPRVVILAGSRAPFFKADFMTTHHAMSASNHLRHHLISADISFITPNVPEACPRRAGINKHAYMIL